MAAVTVTPPEIGASLYWAPDGHIRNCTVRAVRNGQVLITWFHRMSKYTYGAWLTDEQVADECAPDWAAAPPEMVKAAGKAHTGRVDSHALFHCADGPRGFGEIALSADFLWLADPELRAACRTLRSAGVTADQYRVLVSKRAVTR